MHWLEEPRTLAGECQAHGIPCKLKILGHRGHGFTSHAEIASRVITRAALYFV